MSEAICNSNNTNDSTEAARIIPMPPHARRESENGEVKLGTLVPKPDLFQVSRQVSETPCSASIPTSIEEQSEGADDPELDDIGDRGEMSPIPQPSLTHLGHEWFRRTVSPYCDIDGMDE
jgi:hypothetical protein